MMKYKSFFDRLSPTKDMKILDLGCGQGTYLEENYPYRSQITALDISDHNIKAFKKRHPNITIIKGDGLKPPFKDKEFDIVFSNVVIEHVGGRESQELFAAEIQRVGKRFFITTPNKWFPFEPHYRMPFYQFIPKRIQRWLSKFASIGNYKRGEWEDISLLSRKRMRILFRDAEVIMQRVTIIAVK